MKKRSKTYAARFVFEVTFQQTSPAHFGIGYATELQSPKPLFPEFIAVDRMIKAQFPLIAEVGFRQLLEEIGAISEIPDAARRADAERVFGKWNPILSKSGRKKLSEDSQFQRRKYAFAFHVYATLVDLKSESEALSQENVCYRLLFSPHGQKHGPDSVKTFRNWLKELDLSWKEIKSKANSNDFGRHLVDYALLAHTYTAQNDPVRPILEQEFERLGNR